MAPLRGFSNTETLCSEYKYYCEECRSKQEAHKRSVPRFVLQVGLLAVGSMHPCVRLVIRVLSWSDCDVLWRRMRVKKLPMILALHLKRFKYMEQLQRYTKLSYRVVFPLELRLFNTSGDATNPERLYDLVAVVVHCGRCVGGHALTIPRLLFLTFSTSTEDRQMIYCCNKNMHFNPLAQE